MNNVKRLSCAIENCGTYVMDRELYDKLKSTGETFHCPEGHPQHFRETTESKLRDRIETLEQKLKEMEDEIQERRRHVNEIRFKKRKEVQRRKDIQQALLPAVNGIIGIDDETWLWGCACGGAAYTIFESEDRAKEALSQHREKSCNGDVSRRVEAVQNLAAAAIEVNNE